MLIDFAQVDTKSAEHLRALKYLAVVDLEFTTSPFYLDEATTAERERHRARAEVDLIAWKACLIEVLQNSPSKERKFFRWKVYKGRRHHGFISGVQVVSQEGELEVFPETSL